MTLGNREPSKKLKGDYARIYSKYIKRESHQMDAVLLANLKLTCINT